MSQSVTLNNFDPQNSESPGLGASRIRNLGSALLGLFGYDPTQGSKTITNPFTVADANAGLVALQADPVVALGAATKQYVDGRAAFGVLTGGTLTYTGTITSTYSTNALYIVQNGAAANTGAVTVNLGGGAKPLKKRDGAELAVGEFFAGAYFVLLYDGAAFRLVDFIGGHLTQTLSNAILDADPTVALGAATKQYVDATIGIPIYTALAADIPDVPSGSTATVITTAYTVPATGPCVLMVDYGFYYAQNGGSGRNTSWVEDGSGQKWAVQSVTGDGALSCVAAGAGISPVPYAAGTSVTLTLKFHPFGQNVTVYKVADDVPGDGAPNAPAPKLPAGELPDSYLTVTPMRTHT